MTTTRITFADAFERERARMQLSRRQCADIAGVPVREIKRWGNGESIPSVKEFKRIAGTIPRLNPFPPEWASIGAAVVDGSLDAFRKEMADSVEKNIDKLNELKPEPQSFGAGLQRLREDNEISRDEFADLINVTRHAVECWEENEYNPVVVNLNKLYEVLPELRIGIEIGAIRRPPSQDIPKPVGRTPGEPSSADQSSKPPVALAIVPLPPVSERAPEPPQQSTLAQMAEAYGRARLATRLARVAVEEAQAAFSKARASAQSAEQNEMELLALLDLAVGEEAK